MPTVQEVLKQTGLTDEEIGKLDPKIITGFTQVVSTAAQTLEQAELAKRAQADQWDKEISPALDKWANDSANLSAERDYYKTLAEKAKEGGFVPAAAPFTPPNPAPGNRGADGKFVAGAGDVPGSPKFVEGLRNELGGAFAFVADTSWKYRSLFGTEMPDSPTVLIREATAQRMSPSEWAAKKYNFAAKETEIKAAEQKKHDDAIRAEQKAQSDKEWAERVGNNPDVRQAQVSKFSTLEKAVKSGERPDPLKSTREQRHVQTGQIIRKEIAEQTVQ
jgi:hypothetical protein